MTGQAVATVSETAHFHVLNVKMDTDALGENEVVGSRLWFRVTDNGDTVFHTRLGADDTARLHLKFADHTGKHKIVINKNGEFDQEIVIHTGRHH